MLWRSSSGTHIFAVVISTLLTTGPAMAADAGNGPTDNPKGSSQNQPADDASSPSAPGPSPSGPQQTTRQDEPTCPETSVAPDRPSADEFTLMGVACFKSGEYADAYTFYRRAYDRSPSPLLTAAIGRSLHKLGIYHLAEDYYRQFLKADADQETAASADKIRRRLHQLQSDIDDAGRSLQMTSVPSSAKVSVALDNGTWLHIATTPGSVTLESDSYRFAIRHPDYRAKIRQIDLTANGGSKTLQTTLFHREAGFNETGRAWKRRGTIAAYASIPVIATAGVLFGLSHAAQQNADYMALNDEDAIEKHNQLVLRSNRLSGWGIGFTAAGLTTLGVGTLMIVRGNQLTPSGAHARGTVHPVVSPTSTGFRIIW